MSWEVFSYPVVLKFRTGLDRHDYPHYTGKESEPQPHVTQLVQQRAEAKVKPKSVLLQSLCYFIDSHCCQDFLKPAN